MNDVRARVVRVVSQVTNAPDEAIERSARFADLVDWDSLMHMNLVLGLEQEFGIQFDIDEFVHIDSVERAVELLGRRAP